ncbi:partitioning defective 3 homolog isoform X2 [Daktulosphaira vitifoliae]|uniref:partitioning defective 3 homolog isoform X2 n=1 Tax=Daktulosphaira vitifoliae TaxID=58002 RepID=UPI0021AAB2D7|nr:partitioning defective 3 homolog isoform X2 [Daktulosphaira vitifoliae]
MLESCSSSSHNSCNCGKRGATVIGKIAQVFGRKKTYEVQRIQQLNNLSPTSKSSNSWVTVHSLQSQSDGGILDPDDRLQDVADDREQIIALYDDGDNHSPHHHGGGDGASATSSPDMFHSRDGPQTDIEVTTEQIASGFPALHVRRGSEPALNQLPLESANNLGKRTSNTRPAVSGQSKRWSAAPMIHDPKDKLLKDEYFKQNGFGGNDNWRCSEEEEESELEIENEDKPSVTNHFQVPSFHRDSTNRLSMQFLGDSPGGFRWADAADLANNKVLSLSLPRDHRRKEPLGQATTNPPTRSSDLQTEYIVLSTNGGSLGIHVVPDYNSLGKERGLLVQGIEPGGRVHCDGRLKIYDRIVEINGRSLLDQPFNAIQEIFRDSLHSSELRLRVVKHKNNQDNQTSQVTVTGNKKQPPPPIFPKPSTNNIGALNNNKENFTIGLSNKDNKIINVNTKVATISPTKKTIGVTPIASNILMVANTRKIGKKMELELTKGSHGLGFSITTRDNPAGGNCPIYIKNVLPKGAAVEDGRLRPGDRLLAVNGTELTGKTQGEAVAILRKVPSGAKVKIIVSRQEDVTNYTGVKDSEESFEREVSGNTLGTNILNNSTVQEYVKSLEENQTFPWRNKEILTFDIPVHDSEKAGLGISVKGKTSSHNNSNEKSTPQDLGIFIKNVLHGGAASRDGRLRTNDQLLYINGISLIGQTNAAAMETLRRTMIIVDPGPVPGAISLTVARRKNSSPILHRRRSRDSSSSLLTDSSTNTETFGRPDSSDSTQNMTDNSGTSDNSDNTVIFMHQKQGSESSTRKSIPTNSPDGIAIRNPVLERLTGQTNRFNGLRNESYYKATHQTTIMIKEEEKLKSPTVNQISGEMLIIEEDPPIYNTIKKKIEEEKPNIIASPPQARTGSTSTDVTYASQLSLDNTNSGFSRDAFGRQSMSEKRHATLDAKNTDTYQRNKKLREERGGDESSNRKSSSPKQQLGPSLGLKKSSSLESLQTMVQEVQMSEEGKKVNARVVRGRGCDESFRAAVDKDGPLSLRELRLDTYGEEGIYPQIGRRQSSLHSQNNYKLPKGPTLASNKKKQGLLKGIGSMFKFGKNRRTTDLNGTLSSEDDNTIDREREVARQNARDEQLRIQEQYQRLMQRQAELEQQNRCEVAIDDVSNNFTAVSAKPNNPEQSRIDRIQQLRAEHQRRHLERAGQYKPDEREKNHYESDFHKSSTNSQNSINRPGSRVGITDPRFNHYVNFQEIQQNLSAMHETHGVKLRHNGKKNKSVSCYYDTDDESRRQLHYHSQRRDPKESVVRPSSNYFEYESVMRSLPYSGGSSRLVDNNSNSLVRQGSTQMNGGLPQGSRQSPRYYPVAKSNYPLYNYNSDVQSSQSVSGALSHQRSTINNNYVGNNNIYQRSSPHGSGPYITQVHIRDNNHHIIQSPNI